jgi:DNA primase
VKEFASGQVAEHLAELGIDFDLGYGEELPFHCPYKQDHAHGDRNASASINVTTGAWICHGCGRTGGINVLTRDFSPLMPQPVRRVDLSVAQDNQSLVDRVRSMWQAPEPIEKEEFETVSTYYFPRASHQMNEEVISFLLRRGLSPTEWDAYRLGWDHLSRRITIPYQLFAGEEEFRCLGFKGRAVEPHIRPKYKVLGGAPYPFAPMSTSSHPYVPSKLANVLLRDRLVLCEGEFDAIVAHAKLGMPTMAFPGASLSGQSMLNARRTIETVFPKVRTIYIVFDGDDAGRRATVRAVSYFKRWYNILVYQMPDGQDLSDRITRNGSAADGLEKHRAQSIIAGAIPHTHPELTEWKNRYG